VTRLPKQFAEHIDGMSFADAKEDRPLLPQLYKEAFRYFICNAKRIDYSGLDWGDEEAEQLAVVIRSGALANVEYLYLDSNNIGQTGMKALQQAISQGFLRSCESVVAEGNPSNGDSLMRALKKAAPLTDAMMEEASEAYLQTPSFSTPEKRTAASSAFAPNSSNYNYAAGSPARPSPDWQGSPDRQYEYQAP
jgi:hypothetical protein